MKHIASSRFLRNWPLNTGSLKILGAWSNVNFNDASYNKQQESNGKGQASYRGGGCGLEIPCEYTFEGDSFSITWLENKLIEGEFLAKEAYSKRTFFCVHESVYCTSAHCGHLEALTILNG